jgi:hypothetical protein
MSSRERWIVYPLLFLTFGITMRMALIEKYFPPKHLQIEEIVANQIRCNDMQSANRIASPSVIAAGVQCEAMQIVGPKGRPTVVVGTDAKTKGGSITTLSSAGAPGVLLKSTDAGGVAIASEFVKASVAPPKESKKPSASTSKEPEQERSKEPGNPKPAGQ